MSLESRPGITRRDFIRRSGASLAVGLVTLPLGSATLGASIGDRSTSDNAYQQGLDELGKNDQLAKRDFIKAHRNSNAAQVESAVAAGSGVALLANIVLWIRRNHR